MKPPSNPAPGRDASSLTGTYTNPYYGRLEVEEQQGHLILRLPLLGTYYEVTHWDGNTWTITSAMRSQERPDAAVDFIGSELCVQNLKVAYSPVFTKVK